MATYVETKIFEGLMARLVALAFTPALPIALPNVSFTKPSNQKYLAPRHLPNAPEQISIGSTGTNRHIGLFQIEVHWPANDGETRPKEIAGAVAAHFKRGLEITREGIVIRIDRPPVIAASVQDGDTFFIPVTVSYLADAENP